MNIEIYKRNIRLQRCMVLAILVGLFMGIVEIILPMGIGRFFWYAVTGLFGFLIGNSYYVVDKENEVKQDG